MSRLSEGLIHQSFIVNCEGTRYVIQGLHPNLSDEGILEDYAAVTEAACQMLLRARPTGRQKR